MITMPRRGQPLATLVPVGRATSRPHLAEAHGWLAEGDPYVEAIDEIVTDRPTHVPRA